LAVDLNRPATPPSVPQRGSSDPARTTDPYGSPDYPLQDELTLVITAMNSVLSFHAQWVDKIERRYRAYRGIAESRNQSKKVPAWRSKLTTPYILQVVEGMIATMLDSKPAWDVCPKPRPGESMDDTLARQQSAKIATAALQWAMDEDDFRLKQRPFMQQDLITGVTVVKCLWAYECRECNHLQPVEVQVVDDAGLVRDRYMSTEEQSRMTVMRDGPTMVVRDIRDFFWPESAKSIDDAAWLIDRSWHTYDDLLARQEAGYYQHVEELSEARNSQMQYGDTGREQMLQNQNRTRGLIEVLEYWTDERVITVGNRQVVLASVENPLQIKRKPFVICSAMPDAFEMIGISVVEALAQVQEYLWTVQNQRIDALRLLTNVVTLVRSDVDDPDAFEWFPGATWIVEDVGQVEQLKIDPTVASITLEAEALLKGDLQNMMGGLPMASGVNSGAIDQETATGMSIITSIAQKLIQARKQHYMWAWAKVGELFLGMMGQMLREERTIPQIGPDGSQQLLVIHPLDLQGEFEVNVNVLDQSAVRQEKISEAMALYNTALSGMPMHPVNLDPYLELVLEAYGIQDPQVYLQPPKPPPQPPQAGGGPPPPGGPQMGPAGSPQPPAAIQAALSPPGPGGNAAGQTNVPLAASRGLALSPGGFAAGQVQAAQTLGLGTQR